MYKDNVDFDKGNHWCKSCRSYARSQKHPKTILLCSICGCEYVADRINSKCCSKSECKVEHLKKYHTTIKRQKNQAMTEEQRARHNADQRQYKYSKNQSMSMSEKKRKAEIRRPQRQEELACNINSRLKKNLRGRLSQAIKNNQKSGSAVRDLGCTIAELKSYLESKFLPGMSWDNWSLEGWHIDHIEPLSKFDLSDPIEFKKACHFANLQPLWAKDNLSKGSK
jgi:hypothetical protein